MLNTQCWIPALLLGQKQTFRFGKCFHNKSRSENENKTKQKQIESVEREKEK
jgi:hypothetical protein